MPFKMYMARHTLDNHSADHRIVEKFVVGTVYTITSFIEILHEGLSILRQNLHMRFSAAA